MTRFRADFFNTEVSHLLRGGAMDQLDAQWEEMPDPKAFGIGNWLDLLVVRSRFLNANGAETARMDQYVPEVPCPLYNHLF